VKDDEKNARKYNHGEAFCLMTYQSRDGSAREVLWNSRDGVTPFIISSRDGTGMEHIDWHRDKPVPDYKPPVGSRIFVDATEELVRPSLEKYIDRIFHDCEGGYWKTREEAYAALLPDWLKPGSPWIVEVL